VTTVTNALGHTTTHTYNDYGLKTLRALKIYQRNRASQRFSASIFGMQPERSGYARACLAKTLEVFKPRCSYLKFMLESEGMVNIVAK
jgi:hypothetical protein